MIPNPRNRSLVWAATAATLLLLSSVPATRSAELSFALELPAADVSLETARGAVAATVSGRDYYVLADEGNPAIPYRVVTVVLPQGQTVDEFSVISEGDVTLASGITPVIAGPVMSSDGRRANSAALAPHGDGVFPAQRARYLGTGHLHGYSVASFLVFPVRVAGDELLVSEHLDLVVTTRPDDREDVVVPLRHRDGFRERVADELGRFVINPEAVNAYSLPTPGTGGKPPRGFEPTSYPSLDGSPVDYLIITADSLVSTYQALADWKTAEGVPAVIRTVEWIQNNTRHGVDLQETIRNFIIDAYAKWGVTYVLLAGDTDVIPARLGRSTVLGEKDLPADMYYGCLDGDWNMNHNEYFGEASVIFDAPDLYAEVYVGRLPGSTVPAAQTLIGKVMDYESAVDPTYTNKMMLLAEVLFPIGWASGETIYQDGASLSEYLYLVAFTDSLLSVTKQYQNYTPYPDAVEETVAGVVDSLESGYNIVNHIGHGFRFNMSVGDGSVTTQHADALVHPNRMSNFYLLNCTAVAYTYFCLGEHLLLNPVGGAVSIVGANESALPISSQPYMNEYFHLLFNQDVVNIGEAFARSRLPRTGIAGQSDNPDTWTHYIYSILADPEMQLWTGPVEPLVVTHPATTPLGSGLVTVEVLDSQGPVESASVCLSKGTDDYRVGQTDAAGQVTVDFTAESPGDVSVVVTATNRIRHHSTIAVTGTAPPYVSFDDLTVDDDSIGTSTGNGDGVIDAGETVELLVGVTNSGDTASGNVTLVLRSQSGSAIVEDSTASVGVLASAETRSASDPFRVAFSQYIDDEEPLKFVLVAKNDGVETWTDSFFREVHAPEIEFVVLRIDDSALGNGDGVNQDNETFDLYYEIKNFGSGAAVGLSASVTDLSGAFIFDDSLDTYPDCGASSAVENEGGFRMHEVDTSVPNNIRIDVVDAYGRTTWKSFELRPPVPPTTAAFDPSLGPDRLELVWEKSASSDAAGYRVYRSTTSGGPYSLASVDPVYHTVFVDYPLQPTKTFYYKVSTVDGSGNESALSAEFVGSTNAGQVGGWPLTMTMESTSSPVIGDIDGDQDFEIVVGNEKVYAWHHDGVELIDYDDNAQTWGLLSTAGNAYVSHIALSEVDSIAGYDIIAASRDTREVYVFDYQGNVIAGWPQPVENAIRAGLLAADLDGDGVREIVAVDEKGIVYAWNTDGGEWIDGDSDPLTDGVFKRTAGSSYLYATPAAADLDSDGLNEIILGTQSGQVFVWNEDGSDVPGWPQSFVDPISGAIAVGDIDGDGNGDLELVVCEQGGTTTALHHDGSYLWQVWVPNGQSFGSSPALGDLTNDGTLETVLAASNGYVYVITAAGGLPSGWPVQYSQTFTESSPLVADIDHDGGLDVILGDEARFITAWDAGGNVLAGFPLSTDDAVRATPTIADVDKDGDVDLVAVTWSKSVYVWDFPKMFDPHRAPWASYHANLYNDGNLTTPLPTGIMDVAFAFDVGASVVSLSWYLPPEAGYHFDVYRARATREGGSGGAFAQVASGVGVDEDGRLQYVDTRVEPGVSYAYRIAGSGDEVLHETPAIYVPVSRAGMEQNHPNPFNPATRITYRVPEGPAQRVELVVYDVRGARVRTLVEGTVRGGRHEVTWDGRDDAGTRVSSGVYFYRMVQRNYTATRKMLLLK